ncbi:MAG TPA: SUMF1/EgtB/PvdO family nonheme iron enzyme, partial [Acidimicrobiales bacterium]
MVRVEGGHYLVGADHFYQEERRVHPVDVEDFSIDRLPVTNRAFAIFVQDTAYVTLAERPVNPADYPDARDELVVPGGAVFRPPD